jgi:hypothetical protein
MTHKNLIIFVFLSGFLAGCGENGGAGSARYISPEDQVLLEVDGAPVTIEMLEFMMANRGINEDDQAGMQALLDELVRLQVVANEAQATGLADEPELRAKRAIRDLEALQMAYFDAVYRREPITDEAIGAAYQDQLARSGDYQYRLETVAFPTQNEAMRQIVGLMDTNQGRDEQPIDSADAWSETQSAGQASPATDWIDRSQLPERLRPELAKAQVGQVLSLPLPAPGSDLWLVARISDRRAFEAPPLEDLREGIARSLVRQRITAAVDALYDQADIVPVLPATEAPVEPLQAPAEATDTTP